MRSLTLAAALLALADASFAITGSVEVSGGTIRGTTVGPNEDVYAFKGVPFAAPPVGNLRWKAPQAVIPWEGVLECAEFSPMCPQADYNPSSIYYRPPREQSEDCLYLNIWTAAESAGEKRPVMVWIHGGALTRGTAAVATYDGSNLARKGVVLVTVNYRLGAFGYLAHPELSKEDENGSSGSYGMLDQIAALEWVQANISRFGGDPGRVTIFGESAGSWSVCYLQATPMAKGLFHRAIGESGGVFAPMPTLADAEKAGVGFAEALGAGSLREMRAKSSDEVLAAFDEFRGGLWRPSVDGWSFDEEIFAIFSKGKQNDVPVIVGSNADEWTTLGGTGPIREKEDFVRIAHRQYGDLAGRFLEVYPAGSDEEAKESYLASNRDRTFSWQMRTWARLMDNVDSEAYLYFFTRIPPRPGSEFYRAYHASEIMYAFDNLQTSSWAHEPEDHRVAAAMSQYWVNFATAGDPNGADLPPWSAYDTESEPAMEFGDFIRQRTHVLQKENDFFDAHYRAQRGE